jgi:hypothetical protein
VIFLEVLDAKNRPVFSPTNRLLQLLLFLNERAGPYYKEVETYYRAVGGLVREELINLNILVEFWNYGNMHLKIDTAIAIFNLNRLIILDDP